MSLSTELASQFAKITNDDKPKRAETTHHGTMVEYNGEMYVQLDGSEILTPVSSTVETADGDRVMVTLKNHTATVTGNNTDPAVGIVRAGGIESKIEQTADKIRSEVSDTVNGLSSEIEQTADAIRSEVSDTVNGLSSEIKQTADSISSVVADMSEYSEFKQTIEGFAFMNKGGTVKIGGGDINLTGSITFSDLNSATQSKITTAQSTADSASVSATTAYNKATSAASTAATASAKAQEAFDAIPDYITSTKITSTTIEAPTITGGEFRAVDANSFVTMDGNGMYLYHKHTSVDRDNVKYPKITLNCSDDGKAIYITMGAGNQLGDGKDARFIITKTSGSVSLLFYGPSSSGGGSGITVDSEGIVYVRVNGVETPIGGSTGSSTTAVFA